MYTGSVTSYFTKQPLAGVPVSDGKSIVLTDTDGRFCLPGREKAQLIYVNLLTECHDDWYLPIEGHTGAFDFCVKPVIGKESFSFLHISDTEIEGRSQNDWLDFVRKTVKKEQPLFFANTGDLCREDGLRRHSYLMNSESVGVPVRYTIGNHDLCGNDYGEKLYEKYYGPTWYSFDCGKIHFVFLSIGCGDCSSAYTLAEREEWLKADLALKAPDKGVVLLCHYFHPNPAGYGHTVERMLELAGDKGLKALIYGHMHVNSVYEYKKILGICSSRPDSGGIDSSVAGIRRITVRGTDISTELIANMPEATTAHTPDNWCVSLGRNIFSSPIEADGALWVCTGTDSYPDTCGIYKLDIETGNILAHIETGPIKGNAAYSDGRLYVQDSRGTLYCVDTKTATVLWKAANLPATLYTRSGVLVAEDKVIAGHPGFLCALQKESGTRLWAVYPPFHEDSPSACVYDAPNRLILVSGHWYGLYALSVDTGELAWENRDIPLGHFGTSTPLLEDGLVYKRGNVEIGVVCSKTGQTLRRADLGISMDVGGACAIDGDTLYVPTATHGVLAVDKTTLAHTLTFPTEPARLFTAPYFYGNIQTVESTPTYWEIACSLPPRTDTFIFIISITLFRSESSTLEHLSLGLQFIKNTIS